jgi:hypothetical protein
MRGIIGGLAFVGPLLLYELVQAILRGLHKCCITFLLSGTRSSR